MLGLRNAWKINSLLCPRFFRQDLKRCKTLTATCKENLSLMVKRFQQQKNEYLETLKVGCHFSSKVNDNYNLKWSKLELTGQKRGLTIDREVGL